MGHTHTQNVRKINWQILLEMFNCKRFIKFRIWWRKKFNTFRNKIRWRDFLHCQRDQTWRMVKTQERKIFFFL